MPYRLKLLTKEPLITPNTVQVKTIRTIRPTAEPWSATRATARERFDPNSANLVTHDPLLL
jgi:hypothetical protein